MSSSRWAGRGASTIVEALALHWSWDPFGEQERREGTRVQVQIGSLGFVVMAMEESLFWLLLLLCETESKNSSWEWGWRERGEGIKLWILCVESLFHWFWGVLYPWFQLEAKATLWADWQFACLHLHWIIGWILAWKNDSCQTPFPCSLRAPRISGCSCSKHKVSKRTSFLRDLISVFQFALVIDYASEVN